MTGYRSTKLGTQTALISRPVKHCATWTNRNAYCILFANFAVLYSTVPVRAPVLYLCYLRCTVPVPALCLYYSVFHSRAAPRCTPLPCSALRAIHSPFWGQKPVIVLYRGYIKRGCFWPKKVVVKKCPGNYYFPPKLIFAPPHTPQRNHKFLCTASWPNTFCKRSALNIHLYSKAVKCRKG